MKRPERTSARVVFPTKDAAALLAFKPGMPFVNAEGIQCIDFPTKLLRAAKRLAREVLKGKRKRR